MTALRQAAGGVNLEQLLFESNPDCVKILDLDGRFLAMNQHGQHILSVCDFSAIKGELWEAVWPQESRPLIAASIAEARNGRVARFEAHGLAPNGISEWWDVTVAPILGDHGKPVSILAIARDITGRKQAEDELRLAGERAELSRTIAEAHRAQLHALLEAAPVGIGYADSSGRLVLFNSANRMLWGDGLSQANGADQLLNWKGWWADGSARHGEPIQPSDWALARALRGEHVQNDIVSIEPFNAAGTRKTVLLRATPVRDLAGSVVGAVVALMDISNQVRVEAELRESEAKFRTITNALPQMVWSTQPDGYHDYYNKQWYEFTGVLQGSTDGDGWAGLFHPEDQPRAWEKWRHSLATGEDYAIEYRLRHRTGEYRWVLGRALPVHDDAGRIIRWMGTCTDIHEQKLAQVALEESEESLRQADRRKDEFLAMLAHELRNPLAPISTAAELLRLSLGDAKKVAKAADIIARQVRHMTDLVNDLLDVSRVTRGLVKLALQVLDIKDAVHAAMEQVRPLIEARKHTLSARLGGAPLWVRGDRTRLIQVIANLLNNAAKYTPPGGEIILEALADRNGVKVHVRDTGEGIEESLLPHIFDLFSQAHRSVDRTQGGLGIGLALVKSIATLHHGDIAAQSHGAGSGSTFTLTLPAASVAAQREDMALPRPAILRTVPLHVVVVDDNIDAAMTLASLIEAHGHRAATFHTGEALLAQADEMKADIYLLDIGLPGMNGYELARRLRQRSTAGTTRFYALTGYGQEHDRDESLAAGFNEHFVKPLRPEELQRLLTPMN
jgi:PAS domain S-box-containing protein